MKKLAASRRRGILCIVPAVCEGNISESPNSDSAARGCPECKSDLRSRQKELQLWMGTSDRNFSKPIQLVIEKRIVEPSDGLREMSDGTSEDGGDTLLRNVDESTGLHIAVSQKSETFISTAARTSVPTI
jgi:hypothetical protein